jgi:hypothetical protein
MSEAEIEITPQMIEAGVDLALAGQEGESYQIADLVEALYSLAIAQTHQPDLFPIHRIR